MMNGLRLQHCTSRPIQEVCSIGSVSNYRPISLTYVACKIMESIIAKSIYELTFGQLRTVI